jgi:uncharacterized protein YecE (DUF72 family)
VSAPRVRIGTSGWDYDHWVGPFYPQGSQAEDRLRFYAERFDCVELNSTFYRLPEPRTVRAWHDGTPAGFLFACKASRYVTHMKKLADPAEATTRLFEAIRPLGSKLGPILFQLPPHWRVDTDRLDAFLAALPTTHRYAFELRDSSWWTDEVAALLERNGAALCAFDLEGRRSPPRRTAAFAYVRLHGPDGAYRGRYDGRTLRGWARRFARWRAEGAEVFCFFDNDERGFAAEDAQRLRTMVAEER